MTKTILVAGSLHYDIVVDAPRLPALDETLFGQSVRYISGGKGRNQAAAAALNGAKTFMAGRVGNDAGGEMLKKDLADQGVDISLLQTGKGEASGMSVALVMPGGEYGAVVVSGANLQFDPERVDIPENTGLLVLQNEIAEQTNIAIARKARQAGAKVILNAAPARELPGDLAQLIDIIIVNRGEAEAMAGRAVGDVREAMDAAAMLCQRFGKAVITLGGQGAVHMRAGARAEHQPAFRAQVVSAHGAGDFFVGALANQLASGSEFEAAIHYAQAAGAVYVATEIDKRNGIRPVHIRARLGED
jgi:ribokinase